MRKLLTVLASAAVVVGLGAPVGANGRAQSADQPITAMGKGGGHHGGHRDHDGGRRGHGDHDGRRGHDHDGHDGDHDGYRHHRGDYDRGYYRHHYRDRYYYDGYYGCGYYPDCDPYYGGYYGGRRYYYDRNYDDRDCSYRGPRYDNRCDCYHRDTRCDRYQDRDRRRGCGSGDCYRTYTAEEPQPTANAPAAEPAPAPESAPVPDSPSPQQQ